MFLYQEEKYKKAKAKEKERKAKLKELEEEENSKFRSDETSFKETSLNNNNNIDNDDDGLRAPHSSRSLLGLTWLNGGLANGQSSGSYSDRDGYNARSARQILPPLEDSPRSGNKDKKRNKKLKNKIGVNDGAVHEIDDDSLRYSNNLTSSVSRIQVESVNQNDEDSDDLIRLSGRRDPFRNSQGRYKQDEGSNLPYQSPITNKKKGKKKKPSASSDQDDDFDTLRLSQHLDYVDAMRIQSPEDKPSLSNGKGCLQSLLWCEVYPVLQSPSTYPG